MKDPKIVSGGQTGVDQGALDFALKNGWSCGGWCPEGRKCENGRIPANYPLREVGGNDHHERTRRNVRDSDATLILTWNGFIEPGTALTLYECRKSGKPFLHEDMEMVPGMMTEPAGYSHHANRVREWLGNHRPAVLNIAGNRESNSPGIQSFTQQFLDAVFFGDK